jgi:hypothetical protein
MDGRRLTTWPGLLNCHVSNQAHFHRCFRVVWWPVNQTIPKRICRHCKAPFIPNRHNHTRQHFCSKAACRKARKIKSHQLWLAKNPNAYKGSANVQRVRDWREDHPDYAKRSRAKRMRACKPQPLRDLLQDSVTRKALITGLIADLYGCALQDSVEKKIRALIMKGMKIQLAMAGPEEKRRLLRTLA